MGGMWDGAVVGYGEMAPITFFFFHVLSLEAQIPKVLTRALRKMEAKI